MKKTPFVILVCVVVGLAFGWWWLESSTRPDAPGAGPGELRPLTTTPAPAAPPPLPPADTPAGVANFTAGLGEAAAPATMDATSNPEDQRPPGLPTIGDILEDPTEDHAAVARRLSALVRDPRLSTEERAEALAHTLNLSAGNEASVLTPLVKDPAVTDELAETILDEALNRPLTYQADLYLEALRDRPSPNMQTKIREHLVFLTGGEDLGPDPARWAPVLADVKKQWED